VLPKRPYNTECTKPAGVAPSVLWDGSVGNLLIVREVTNHHCSGTGMGWPTIEGDSPVRETIDDFSVSAPKYCGTREIPWESAGTIRPG